MTRAESCLLMPPFSAHSMNRASQCVVVYPVMQVKKEAKELERQFGSGAQIRLPGKIAALVRDINGTEVEMATIMIFGDSQKCEHARLLLLEAVDNKEQKQKQRQKVRPSPMLRPVAVVGEMTTCHTAVGFT